MLHMITDVEGELVERTVIGVSLLAVEEHVVLADEVAGQRVKSHRQEGAGDQVDQRFRAEKVEDGRIEGNLRGKDLEF